MSHHSILGNVLWLSSGERDRQVWSSQANTIKQPQTEAQVLCCKCSKKEIFNSAWGLIKDIIQEVSFKISLEGWRKFGGQKVGVKVIRIKEQNGCLHRNGDWCGVIEGWVDWLSCLGTWFLCFSLLVRSTAMYAIYATQHNVFVMWTISVVRAFFFELKSLYATMNSPLVVICSRKHPNDMPPSHVSWCPCEWWGDDTLRTSTGSVRAHTARQG